LFTKVGQLPAGLTPLDLVLLSRPIKPKKTREGEHGEEDQCKYFRRMKEALRDAAAYERDEAVNLRGTRIPSRPKEISPREIRRIRQALKASQPLFAAYLNVSTNAVRSWEQGTRRPRQAALKLLMIAKKDPKALLVA
jgi:DNA-binding transcriptional regulator YiaG